MDLSEFVKEDMSLEAKAKFREALKKAAEDQQELLDKAKHLC